MANDTDRLYARLDTVESEQRNLMVSVSTLQERVKNIERDDIQQNTELGNIKQSIGRYSSLLDNIGDQIKSLTEERDRILQNSNSSQEAFQRLASFEKLCEEKLKNMSENISRVKEHGDFSTEKVSMELSSIRKNVDDLKTKINYAYITIVGTMFSFICWMLRQWASSQGWL